LLGEASQESKIAEESPGRTATAGKPFRRGAGCHSDACHILGTGVIVAWPKDAPMQHDVVEPGAEPRMDGCFFSHPILTLHLYSNVRALKLVLGKRRHFESFGAA
jgi:hypothetical protein